MTSDQCITCEHYTMVHTCKAFPSGIPEDILTGEFDHTQIHPDQSNNIIFEPVKQDKK